ncbi:MAG: sulfite exporter TauE/SafE family protein [Pseudomonadota bacterium]
MSDILIAPLLLGLSTGVYCVVYCIPFVAPVMVTEERKAKENFNVLAKFILGRLLGYLAFGLMAGYLGTKLGGVNWQKAAMIALALLSIILILHAVGLWQAQRFSLCAFIKRSNPDIPLVMGVLLGVNACPPFLLSLTYVLTLQSTLKGLIYFFMFFIGTSVYFIPLFFLGYLNKVREFQIAGRICAVIVGFLFLGYSIYNIVWRLP